jgi:peptidoglycan/xylan/chitin deacetylase (PgdA/CDA1 family)
VNKNYNTILIILLLLPVLLSGNNAKLTIIINTPNNAPDIPAYYKVPVLCYHNINVNPEKANELKISEAGFERQIRALRDSGYHSITPDQLYDHLTKNATLPPKPVMFTFDDTHETHFSIAAAILEKYEYKGVFFIMTVCIGKKNYMSAQQIKTLAEKGHSIECHTYDHPSVKSIIAKQWGQQIDKPKKKLETLIGKPVEYFAYPYGVWNEPAIIELKQRGFKAAFQLTGMTSQENPLYTIKRMLVSGTWTGKDLLNHMAKGFRQQKSTAAQ